MFFKLLIFIVVGTDCKSALSDRNYADLDSELDIVVLNVF
jgi:hypothetical protein